MGLKFRGRGKVWHIQRTLHSWWKEKVAYPVTQIDDYVKLIFKKKRIQKTGRRYGSKKTGGRSGCGVVIKGVDRDKWITISEMAVPLKACTAMAAEVMGASVPTGNPS